MFRVILIAGPDEAAKVDAALAGCDGVRRGTCAVQLRAPGMTMREYVRIAFAMAQTCEKHGASFFVNNHLDVALVTRAHLHLPGRGLLPSDVRPHLPADRLISVAVHAATDAVDAADLALVSPVFQTESKPGVLPLGLSEFASIATRLPVPSFALGGINPARARTLRGVGVGVGVVSNVFRAAAPALALAELVDATA